MLPCGCEPDDRRVRCPYARLLMGKVRSHGIHCAAGWNWLAELHRHLLRDGSGQRKD